jgi:hypothetical protein
MHDDYRDTTRVHMHLEETTERQPLTLHALFEHLNAMHNGYHVHAMCVKVVFFIRRRLGSGNEPPMTLCGSLITATLEGNSLAG